MLGKFFASIFLGITLNLYILTSGGLTTYDVKWFYLEQRCVFIFVEPCFCDHSRLLQNLPHIAFVHNLSKHSDPFCVTRSFDYDESYQQLVSMRTGEEVD